MRRIESAEEAEKRRKRTTSILSILMLGILLFGTAGFAFSYYGGTSNSDGSTDSSGTQEGFNSAGQWVKVLNGQSFYFTNSPEDVKDIKIDLSKTLGEYSGNKIYIAGESNSLSYNEIVSVLGQYSSGLQPACFGKCEDNLPEKTCSDNIIVLNESEENSVSQENNCVFINGNVKAADAFLFEILGIN